MGNVCLIDSLHMGCQMISMTDKTHTIVAAATRMFTRYGYSKTTMGDIASEAGVARQTVYNAFPGKEEIMRAVVRQAWEDTFTKVSAAWQGTIPIAEKLEVFHQYGPLAWFEAIRKAPDWAELMEGMHAAAHEEIRVYDARWLAVLETMFADALPDRPADAMPIADIAEFFYSTSLNAKHGATDLDHLKARLTTIRIATLALIAR